MTRSTLQLIAEVGVSEDTVTVRADERFTQDYLHGDFYVKYDLGGDLPAITEELAVVPFLANVAPIVWLSGRDVCVPALDATFADALEYVRKAFAGMYPALRWEGSITADRLHPGDGSPEQLALLFSGGVDSVYSSISMDRQQLLVTVRGADVALDNDVGWDAVCRQAVEFGREHGHENAFVESNFRRFLDLAALGRRWPAVGSWWGGVQHGIGLLGLLAPVVPSGRVVIAATHTPALGVSAWGSNPKLDTSVRWGGVEVEHHGYDASRQDKVESIVAMEGRAPQLRVCFSNPYGDGGNCGICEKCLRTFTGLVVAGAQPVDYGIPMSRKEGGRAVRRRFATYRVALGANQAWQWRRIQASLATAGEGSENGIDDPETARFLHWLSTFDFTAYERRWRLVFRARGRLMRAARRFPIAERTVRRLVAVSQRLRGRAKRLENKVR